MQNQKRQRRKIKKAIHNQSRLIRLLKDALAVQKTKTEALERLLRDESKSSGE